MKLSPFEDSLSLLNSLLRDIQPAEAAKWRPPLSIRDEADRFVIECELPGVSPDEIRLDIEAEVLEISGVRPAFVTCEKETMRMNERAAGEFSRMVRLDDSVDKSAIEADYVDGVLMVTAPRTAETLPRRIEIRSSSVDGSP